MAAGSLESSKLPGATMKRRNFLATVVISSSLLVSQAVLAAPASIHSPVNAMFGKPKTVKIILVNDSGAPIEVKCGDEVVKLDAGKPVTLKLANGTRVVANSATPLHEQGSLIAQVSDSLSGATLHIK
jgi:hypothetical protein